MKLKFDPSLDYQRGAIDAVVNVFDGQPFVHAGALVLQTNPIGGLFQSELGIGNRLALDEEEILDNVRAIQEANGIEKCEVLQGMEFSVEMETGTGKTYVYLRTIFELNRAYGFRKFIIVVPSVAIREGVLKSIDMTKCHFETLYGRTPFDHFVYDARRLEKVRQFAGSNHIQIMVINIQSFLKDVADAAPSDMTEDDFKKVNVINRENDRMSGRRPIEFIQAANPIVIIDEPQSVDSTEKSRRAIGNLNPLATLRYSATHRRPYNLVYRLDPVRAYDLRLVKRIEVASIRSEDSFNDAYVKLLETDNTNGYNGWRSHIGGKGAGRAAPQEGARTQGQGHQGALALLRGPGGQLPSTQRGRDRQPGEDRAVVRGDDLFRSPESGTTAMATSCRTSIARRDRIEFNRGRLECGRDRRDQPMMH